MDKIDFSSIPNIAWVSLLILGILFLAVITLTVICIVNVLKDKDIKSKILEINQPVKTEIKERFIAEGKDLVDNQSQVAKMMLKSGRIRMYKEGIKLFNIKDAKDLIIFEMITYRISDRLNYELKNDFTRNHITNKTDYELTLYSDAKSKGYYQLITEKLFMFNEKLPNFDLPKIMEHISFEETKKLFTNIYFSARGIAGDGGKNGKS